MFNPDRIKRRVHECVEHAFSIDPRFKLVVISPPQLFLGEAPLILELLDAGLHRYHLRKPHVSAKELHTWMATVHESVYSKLVWHQAHDIAQEFGCPCHNNKQIQSKGAQSASFHDYRALQQAQEYDYAFLSPVFDSISKPDYPAAWELAEHPHHLEACSVPVFALGGVDLTHFKILHEMGFQGAALMGSIWCD